jgi:hypothetical protein
MACCGAFSMRVGARVLIRKMTDQALAVSSASHHTAADGTKFSSCRWISGQGG